MKARPEALTTEETVYRRTPSLPSGFTRLPFLGAVAVTTAAMGVLAFATWQLAASRAEPEAREYRARTATLSRELDTLAERFERAQARREVLEREAQVLREANRLLREQESDRQAELNRLQAELDFYRRLVGTGGARPGLSVYRARLIPTDSGRVFAFDLTLTQNIRRASIISGHIDLAVEGTLGDRAITLTGPELRPEEAAEPIFRFKYFQQIEGFLSLPPGFSPLRLRVNLQPGGDAGAVEHEYAWRDILEPPQKTAGPAGP